MKMTFSFDDTAMEAFSINFSIKLLVTYSSEYLGLVFLLIL